MGTVAEINPVPLAVGVIALIASGTWGFFLLRRRQLFASTPHSRCAGVFLGWNEVEGVARTDAPTISRFTRTPSVVWNCTVEDEVRVTRTESTTDSEGRTRTRQVTSYEWRVVERGGESVGAFSLVDDSGNVLVDPERANVTPRTVLDEVSGDRRGGWFVGDGPTGRVRRREHLIAQGEALFVSGVARLRDDMAAPVIDDKGDGPFVITTRGEKSVQRGYAIWGPVVLCAGAAIAIFASIQTFKTPGAPSRFVDAVPGLLAAATMWIITALVQLYNGLVRVQNRVERAFSLIDVMLQRRHDLIPRLLACVEAAGVHETQLHEQLAELRNGAITPDIATQEVATQTAILQAVIARAEAYPDLQTNANYTQLQTALRDTEDRIAAAREFYNENVTKLSDGAQSFPGLLVARFGPFTAPPLFAAAGFNRVAPS